MTDNTTTWIVQPALVSSMMTGATICHKGVKETTLYYTDGSKETVKTGDISPETDWNNWFSVVGSIQALRKQK